mgnify:CR=1 FL=1
MHTPEELEKKLWKAIKSDRTLMLGLDGAEDGHTRPMTALLEHEGRGPLWIFTSTDNVLAQRTQAPQRAHHRAVRARETLKRARRPAPARAIPAAGASSAAPGKRPPPRPPLSVALEETP